MWQLHRTRRSQATQTLRPHALYELLESILQKQVETAQHATTKRRKQEPRHIAFRLATSLSLSRRTHSAVAAATLVRARLSCCVLVAVRPRLGVVRLSPSSVASRSHKNPLPVTRFGASSGRGVALLARVSPSRALAQLSFSPTPAKVKDRSRFPPTHQGSGEYAAISMMTRSTGTAIR